MKPAFYLENQAIPDVDLRHPELGNPGCGGTEFLFAALPHYLRTLRGDKLSPILLANHAESLPQTVETHRAVNILDAVRKAQALGCTHFVFRPRRDATPGLLPLLEQEKLAAIAWLHVTPTNKHIRELAACAAIKAAVCVEHEQHESLRDTALWKKLTCIVNGFDMAPFDKEPQQPRDTASVLYLGALVPQKGFHLLAQAWPLVLARHPEAHLLVVGTAKVYSKDAPLGQWGLGDVEYEEKHIRPFLSGLDGSPLPSVKILGKLGVEKFTLLHRVTVGVANPSGLTENCPGAALEIQACGTPIVSGAYYGMLDTVRNGETGLLGRTVEDLAANICRLLDDKALSARLGRNGARFVRHRYGYAEVTQRWLELFEATATGKGPASVPLKGNVHKHWKLLVYLNILPQRVFGGLIPWPSTLELKDAAVNLLRKIK